MIYKKYLGIYINESDIQYLSCYKFLPWLMPGKKAVFKSGFPKFVKESKSLRFSLKKTFETIKPSKKREIYICMPRSFFFTRKLEFPSLPLDDVRDSVVNSLESYSHLPVDEIYYDVLFSKIKGGRINALLYYAPRKNLDIYLTQLKETGHLKSVKGVFPFSYGAGPWYFGLNPGSNDKNGVVIQYDNRTEVAVYSKISCINSILMDKSGSKEQQQNMIQDILAQHKISEDQVVYKDENSVTENSFLNENMAGAALAPAFAPIQQISIDENIPRIKFFKPMYLLLPLFILLAGLMIFMTQEIQTSIHVKKSELAKVENEAAAMEKQIDPILKAKSALKRAAEYKGDVEDFVLSKPQLHTLINDLARIVPEDTWFAHLSYKPGIISMQGEGGDVLKVVESLRASEKYKEVKLRGSVSRTKQGKDKFRIDLILKDKRQMSKKGGDESLFK